MYHRLARPSLLLTVSRKSRAPLENDPVQIMVNGIDLIVPGFVGTRRNSASDGYSEPVGHSTAPYFHAAAVP